MQFRQRSEENAEVEDRCLAAPRFNHIFTCQFILTSLSSIYSSTLLLQRY